jgi:hypothetical protein
LGRDEAKVPLFCSTEPVSASGVAASWLFPGRPGLV